MFQLIPIPLREDTARFFHDCGTEKFGFISYVWKSIFITIAPKNHSKARTSQDMDVSLTLIFAKSGTS